MSDWDPVRAWAFIRASRGYRAAWRRRRPQPGLLEPAPFEVRWQTAADAGALGWGLLTVDPHAAAAPDDAERIAPPTVRRPAPARRRTRARARRRSPPPGRPTARTRRARLGCRAQSSRLDLRTHPRVGAALRSTAMRASEAASRVNVSGRRLRVIGAPGGSARGGFRRGRLTERHRRWRRRRPGVPQRCCRRPR